MPKKLQGKCVLITGGSRGIGKAIAIKAANEGAFVIFTYQEQATAALEVVEMINQSGGHAISIQLSLDDPEQIKQKMLPIFQQYKIDILINNAAILLRKHLLETFPEDLDRVYRANLRGPFELSRLVAIHMIQNKTKGLIINISSDRAITMTDGLAAYQIMKAGINMMTQVLARSLGASGIRAITISPGMVRTDMHANIWRRSLSLWYERAKNIPMGAAEPDQIASFVISIAGEEGAYVNGANLIVDGGRTVGVSNESFPVQLRASL